ncbi:MAG: hypothetical protein WDO13_10280 [Verrucomicrobiota bacterium]
MKPRLKRFLKTLVLLVISLFVLVSGVNAALDQVSHSAAQSSIVVYNEKGQMVLAYDGDLNGKVLAKPLSSYLPRFLHRT